MTERQSSNTISGEAILDQRELKSQEKQINWDNFNNKVKKAAIQAKMRIQTSRNDENGPVNRLEPYWNMEAIDAKI